MPLLVPKTKGQWIAAVTAAIAILFFLHFFTRTTRGEAVEVSVENASPKTVFAYIDNTGRHGSSTATQKLRTTANAETPSGLLLHPGTTRSFGTAVGLGDSPTIHVVPVNEQNIADLSGRNDCPFDTVSLRKLEIPSLHAKIKWNGSACVVQN